MDGEGPSRCMPGAPPSPAPGISRYMFRAMAVDQARLDAAIDALSDRERFREAESVVAAAAPKLHRILADALEEGGWFGEAHEAEVRKAATAETDEERLAAVRTLLAEEARMGMMVGVAVGWALAEELRGTTTEQEAET
jgi:hypothetical protein